MDPGSFAHRPFGAHALLDSGDGEKIERFGETILVRPDPQALWRRRDPAAWGRADLVFVRESDRGGRWEAPGARARGRGGRGAALPEREWTVALFGARLVLRTTPFKHVGLFPEQATNWELVASLRGKLGQERPRLLNLFGYTGAASLLAARAGYEVTHVDASRTALSWTRANLEASGQKPDTLRLVLDDALAYARREARRGRRYHAILVDPPRYGRGPKGETWRFEEKIVALLEACGDLLAERSMLILSAYAIGISPRTLANLLAPLEGGVVRVGELCLPEDPASEGPEELAPPRLLPCGFCARWTRGISSGTGA